MLCVENRQPEGLNIPRLVIGAPQGRSGKTTVTLGLLRAFNRLGFSIQPFKKGPDFIDPSWHTEAGGRQCYNLDSFLMERAQIQRTMLKFGSGCRLSLIEGAMGLFDGLDLAGSSSTAEMAKLTCSPVLLVIDATRLTRSVAAIVLGCQKFDPDIVIAGVVLNKVAGSRHEKTLREAVEQFCMIPVIGAIPKDTVLNIPDRHLGLVTKGESEKSDAIIDQLADVVTQYVDLHQVLSIADKAPALPVACLTSASENKQSTTNTAKVKIGVIQDKVFSFYYPENLTALSELGAQLIRINSLEDRCLPAELDALYIGGGFPEVFAAELANNLTLSQNIKQVAEEGLPIYAECGGLMYLGRSIQVNCNRYPMAGLLPFDTCMEPKPQGHGYTILRTLPGSPWFKSGTVIKGHEFHNSRLFDLPANTQFLFELERGRGIDGKHDGMIYKRVLATYNHLHYNACPAWATNFVNQAKEYHSTRWKHMAGEYKCHIL